MRYILAILFTLMTSQAFGQAALSPAYSTLSSATGGKVNAGKAGTNTLTVVGATVGSVGGKPTLTIPGGSASVPLATTATPGKVKPDGTSTTVDSDGTIHSISAPAAASFSSVTGEPADNAKLATALSGKVPEAPLNQLPHVRLNGTWQSMPTAINNGSLATPIDNDKFGYAHDNSWVYSTWATIKSTIQTAFNSVYHGITITWAEITGAPTDNAALSTALNTKKDKNGFASYSANRKVEADAVNAALPSIAQKGALAGTSGTPSGSNKYVTNSDPRFATPAGIVKGVGGAAASAVPGVDYLAPSGTGGVWVERTIPVPTTYAAVVWNGSIYCAVATGGSVITSPDGVTWTARGSIGAYSWTAIAWNGSKFCAVASGTRVTATSPDGITWTQNTLALPPSAPWSGIAGNGSIFVAVAQNGTLASSPDGVTWTVRTASITKAWSAVIWNGSVFCAVATVSGQAITSPDGITWTARTVYGSLLDLNSVAWNGSVLCAVGTGGTVAISADNGITWTVQTITAYFSGTASTPYLAAVAWNGSVFTAVGPALAAVSADNGATWVTRTNVMPRGLSWWAIASNGRNFCALGGDDTTVATTVDFNAGVTGSSAYKDVGTLPGTVAAGDDPRLEGVLAVGYNGGALNSATLTAAITGIGSNVKTLVITPGNWAFNSDVTVPSTITMKIQPGAKLVRTAGKLTVNGPVNFPRQPIFQNFTSTTALSLGSKVKDVYVDWTSAAGDGVANDRPEIYGLGLAVSPGATIHFNPAKTHYVDKILSMYPKRKIKWLGHDVHITAPNGFINIGAWRPTGFTDDAGWAASNGYSGTTSWSGLSIAMTANKNTFTIPAGVNISAGDMITVAASSPYISYYYRAVLANVVSVSGTTATLDVAPPVSFTAATVTKQNRNDGTEFAGFIIDNTGATTGNNLQPTVVLFGNGVNVHDNVVVGGTESAIGLSVAGINTKITRNRVSGYLCLNGNNGGRQGDGIAAYGTNVSISENTLTNNKHNITLSAGTYTTNGVEVRNNYLSQSPDHFDALSPVSDYYWGGSFDSHANSFRVNVVGNTIIGSGHVLAHIRNGEMNFSGGNKMYLQNTGAPSGIFDTTFEETLHDLKLSDTDISAAVTTPLTDSDTANSAYVHINSGNFNNVTWKGVALGDGKFYGVLPTSTVLPSDKSCGAGNHVDSFTASTGVFTCSADASTGGTTDANAVHVNTASEISALATKTTPASGDFLLIEDSAASNVKKKITVGSLPAVPTTSAGIAAVLIDETGTGKVVFSDSPIITGAPVVNSTPGSNIVTNGTFTSDTSGWTQTNWTWVSGAAKHTTGNTSSFGPSSSAMSIGATYKLTFDVTSMTAGNVYGSFGGAPAKAVFANSTNNTVIYTATATTGLFFQPSSDFDGAIDNVQFVQLIGATVDVGSNFHITTDGRSIGIGTNTPTGPFEILGNGESATFVLTAYAGGDNTNIAPGFIGRGARGTLANQIQSKTNDTLVSIGARGHDGTAFSAFSKGSISIKAGENWTNSVQGTYATIETTNNGTTTRSEKLRVTGEGNIIQTGVSSIYGVTNIINNGSNSLSLMSNGSNAWGVTGWVNAGVLESNSAGGLVFSAYNATGDILFQTGGSRTQGAKLDRNGVFSAKVFQETVYAPVSGSSFAVDLANGNDQEFVTNANTTITLPAPVAGKSYTITVKYGGTHTINWAGGGTIKWPSGAAPVATSVSGKYDIYVFKSDATGTYTFGADGGRNY